MKGTVKIVSLFRIPILIHWSFGLLFLWILYEGYANGMDVFQTLWLSAFMIALFVCVIFHEYGHALTARRYGVDTRDIVLLPIGGLARLERLPEKPVQEFWVAIAGPLVNIAIALLLSPYFLLPSFRLESILGSSSMMIDAQSFIPYLIWINIMLAIFNLVPAFPMDGGRILRALLAIPLSRALATRIAAIVGQVFAVGFIALSFFVLESPMLGLIGVFVFFNALSEYRSVNFNLVLDETQVREVMKTKFTYLHPYDEMRTAIAISEMGIEHNFIVVDEAQHPIGVLHQAFIEEASDNDDHDAPVAVYMSANTCSFPADKSIRYLLTHIEGQGCNLLAIEEEGKLIGVVDLGQLFDYLQQETKQK